MVRASKPGRDCRPLDDHPGAGYGGSLMDPPRHTAFPIAWVTTGRRLLLVGGCGDGLCRLKHALTFDWAVITVCTPPGLPPLCKDCCRDPRVTTRNTLPTEEDVAAADLVIEATFNGEEFAGQLADWCRKRGKPLNAMDKLPHCDFYYTAFLERGPLLLALVSGGEAPALTARLKRELDEQLGPGWTLAARLFAETRARLPAGPARSGGLKKLASSPELLDFVRLNDEPAMRKWIDAAIDRM